MHEGGSVFNYRHSHEAVSASVPQPDEEFRD